MTPIRILHLDDNKTDHFLVKREIESKHFPASYIFASTKREYISALEKGDFDIILSDYRMPDFDGDRALELARESCPAIPFIMVTGELGEDRAIETLHRGAWDYILKDNLKRLVPAIERALAEAKDARTRIQTEEKLRQSERDIRLVTDLAPVFIARLDLEQRFTFANRPYAERYDATPEEIIGKYIRDVVGEQKYDLIASSMNEAYAGKQVIADIELPDKKRGFRIMHFRYAPETDGQGTVIGIIVTILDVTDQKIAERESLRAREHTGQILDRVQDGYYAIDRNWEVTYINRRACEFWHVQPEDYIGRRLMDIFPGIESTPVFPPLLKAMTQRASVHYDTLSLTGSVWVDVNAYPNDDGGLVVYFRDITDRKRAEDELRRNEQRYATTLKSIGDAVISTDPSGKILFMNTVAERLTGWMMSDTIGKPVTEVFHIINQHTRMRVENPVIKVLKEGVTVGLANHTILVRKDGAEVAIDDSGAPIRDPDGAITGAVLVFRDITEKRRNEDQLRSSEARFRSLYENHIDGVLLTKPDGAILAANPEACRLFGMTEQEIVNAGRKSVVVKDQNLAEALEERARTGRFRKILLCRRKNGSTFTADVSSMVFLTADGTAMTSMVVRDITDKARMEETIRKSDERLRIHIENSPLAVVEWDKGYSVTRWSNEAENLFGWSASETLGKRIDTLNLIFPDDIPIVEKTMQRLSSGNERTVVSTNRNVTKAGGVIECVWYNSVIAGRDGKMESVMSLVLDITRQKRMEEELRENENRYRSLFENLLYAFCYCEMIYDSGGHPIDFIYLTANSQFEIMSGYKDFIGKRVTELIPDVMETHPEMFEIYGRVAQTGIPENFEIHFKPTGRWFSVSAYSPKKGYVAILFDNTTGRKQAEEALQVSEQRFRSVLKNSPVIVANLDRNLCYTWIYNPIAGFKPEDLIGKKAGMATREQQENTLTLLNEVLVKGKPLSWETGVKGADGEQFFAISAEPLRDADGQITGVSMVSMDITRQKRMEETVRSSEERYHSLFNCMTEGFALHEILFDANRAATDYRYLDFNPAFEQLTGLKRHEILGKTHNEILPGEPERISIYGDVALSGKSAYFDSYSATLKRHFRIFAYRPAPGQCAVIFSDITAQKHAEEEIRRFNVELEERVARRTGELERANKELESFSYSVSHDLRAPLRAINGYAAILLEEAGAKLDPEAKRCLRLIEHNGKMMGQLIDELLAFSRVHRNEMTSTDVDMASLVSSVFDELRAGEPLSRVIDLRCINLAPCKGNGTLLRQVWANLIGNALKFTRTISEPRIAISSGSREGYIVYTITDNGVGFDPRYADKLFGIFQRLHDQEEYEGTGIGLALVKRIIERHGGVVSAAANPGGGATFTFTIPDER